MQSVVHFQQPLLKKFDAEVGGSREGVELGDGYDCVQPLARRVPRF